MREFLLGDPQVRRFFVLIVCTFIDTLAQDVLLEPYGALVLGMTLSETTRLTAWWGGDVLLSMLLSGGFLLRIVGHLVLLRIGLVATIAVFAGEAMLLAVALVLTFRLRVEVSRASREAQVQLRP